MSNYVILLLELVVTLIIWCFVVQSVAGRRLEVFYFVPVSICWLGVPMMIGDLTYQNPRLCSFLYFSWHGIGFILAAGCLFRDRKAWQKYFHRFREFLKGLS